MERVSEYLSSSARGPCVVFAGPGAPVSSVLARLTTERSGDGVVVARSLGTVDVFGTAEALIRSVLFELERHGAIRRQTAISGGGLRHRWLRIRPPRTPVLIVLDRIDLLADGLERLDWLPSELPERVKLVCHACADHGFPAADPPGWTVLRLAGDSAGVAARFATTLAELRPDAAAAARAYLPLLATSRGGITRRLAEAVCRGPVRAAPPALHALETALRGHLVRTDTGRDLRFGMMLGTLESAVADLDSTGWHRRLAEFCDSWAQHGGPEARYALRNRLHHAANAADQGYALAVCADLAYLAARLDALGVGSEVDAVCGELERFAIRSGADEAKGWLAFWRWASSRLRRAEDHPGVALRTAAWEYERTGPVADALRRWSEVDPPPVDWLAPVPWSRTRFGGRHLVVREPGIRALAWSADAARFATVTHGEPSTLSVWSAQSGERLATVNGEAPSWQAAAFGATDELWAHGRQGHARWDLRSSTPAQAGDPPEYGPAPSPPILSPSRQVIIALSPSSGMGMDGESLPVDSSLVAPTGDRVLLNGRGWLSLRQLAYGSQTHPPEVQLLLSGGGDLLARTVGREASLLTAADGQVVATALLQRGEVVLMAVDDAGVMYATCGTRFRRLPGGEEVARLRAFEPTPIGGHRVACVLRPSTVLVLDLSTGRPVAELDGVVTRHVLGGGAGGRYVTTTDDAGQISVWDVATGRVLGTLDVGLPLPTAAVVWDDGARLTTCGPRGAMVWDVPSRRPLARHDLPEARSIVASSDGTRLAFGLPDAVLVRDLRTGGDRRWTSDDAVASVQVAGDHVAVSLDRTWTILGLQAPPPAPGLRASRAFLGIIAASWHPGRLLVATLAAGRLGVWEWHPGSLQLESVAEVDAGADATTVRWAEDGARACAGSAELRLADGAVDGALCPPRAVSHDGGWTLAWGRDRLVVWSDA